jgi:hypothetical protein
MPTQFHYLLGNPENPAVQTKSSGRIAVPNFDFSAFYYPQLIEALMLFKRGNVPELTDESAEEPSIQLLRAFALVGHINNVMIDIVANESTYGTSQLPETIRNQLRLISYELRPATPSQTDIVYKLSRTFSAGFELIPDRAQAATRREGDGPATFFEALTGITIDRTDLVGVVFLHVSGIFYDHTVEAVAGTEFDATLAPGDALYIGHSGVMWDELHLQISTPSVATNGAWEFFDGDAADTRPDSVENLGGGILQFGLNGLLGPNNRSGALVRIRLNTTSTYEEVVSSWDGTQNILQTSLLGQSSPSIDAANYTVGSEWKEIEITTDGTALLDQTGDIEFTLPQTSDRVWRKTEVNGFTGFFLRFRCISVGLGTGPTIGEIRIDGGAQYAIALATQGRSVIGETLGSSNGDTNQRFQTAQDGFIRGSQALRVDDEEWVEVSNFLQSQSQDKHYVVELGESDRANFVFGDGVNGRIPPAGQGGIVADYRFDAKADGNVGANTVVVDKQGLSFVERIYNPRPAAGWATAQSASAESLARAKIEASASLHVIEVALGPDDMVTLTKDFQNASGSKPFSRARAFEEGYGPKTTELIVVARGGQQATSDQLLELQTYFNGDAAADPPVKKHTIANQQVVCSNFEGRQFPVVAIVKAPAGVTSESIQNRLAAILQPEAVQEDGVTYIWDFGGLVPWSRIQHEIFKTNSRIEAVDLLLPATDTQLNPRELPVPGAFSITIVSE